MWPLSLWERGWGEGRRLRHAVRRAGADDRAAFPQDAVYAGHSGIGGEEGQVIAEEGSQPAAASRMEATPSAQLAQPPEHFIHYRREQAPAVRIFVTVMGLLMLGPIGWLAVRSSQIDAPLAMAAAAAALALASCLAMLLRRGMNAFGDALFSGFVVFALAAAGWKAGAQDGPGLYREAFAIIALLGLGFSKLPTRVCALLAIPGVMVPIIAASLAGAGGFSAVELPGDFVLMLVPLLGGLAASVLAERADYLDWKLLHLHAARAARDEMTGAANRLGLSQGYEAVSRQAQRDKVPLTVAIIDMDGLKPVNDSYGHAAGDEAIIHMTDALRHVARRPLDLIARIGGDEFVVVFYGTPPLQAQALLEQARQWLRRHPLPLDGENSVALGFSAGVCADRSGKPMELQEILERADTALYKAKSDGRSRSALAEVGSAPPLRRRRFISHR
jgi:diguanylate cyclase (GGDEF)-like protein